MKVIKKATVSLRGSSADIGYLSEEFQEKTNFHVQMSSNQNPKPESIFIRQIHYASFLWEGQTDVVTFRGRLGLSSFSHNFPMFNYPIMGNILLVKVKDDRLPHDFNRSDSPIDKVFIMKKYL